jgi:hypothetical protein
MFERNAADQVLGLRESMSRELFVPNKQMSDAIRIGIWRGLPCVSAQRNGRNYIGLWEKQAQELGYRTQPDCAFNRQSVPHGALAIAG